MYSDATKFDISIKGIRHFYWTKIKCYNTSGVTLLTSVSDCLNPTEISQLRFPANYFFFCLSHVPEASILSPLFPIHPLEVYTTRTQNRINVRSEMATPVKVYGPALSTAVSRALACLLEKEVEFQLIPVNMAKGEHKKPDFLKIQVLFFPFLSISLSLMSLWNKPFIWCISRLAKYQHFKTTAFPSSVSTYCAETRVLVSISKSFFFF